MLSFEDQIAAHAMAEAPREACGLVLRTEAGTIKALPTENLAEDPHQQFEIPMAPYLAAITDGSLVGYYHSHVDASSEPSDADKHVATEVGLPLWIYSVRDSVLDVHVPTAYRQPLEGRRFVPMVFDCVSLVWDYQRDVRGVVLPLLPRRRADYFHGSPFDWTPWLAQYGAQIVQVPEAGDILVMATGTNGKPNHLGVYLGDGHFLHQPGDVPSKREVWEGGWRKATSLIIRLPAGEAAP
jgi:proteasome lid subunit RPN8/RPN11